MTSADCFETCCECDGLTDKAGRGEDSLYCEVCGKGPFCSDCYEKHLGTEHDAAKDSK